MSLTRAAFAAKLWTASKCAPWTVSTRARTCSSSTPPNVIDCGVCVPECPVDAIKPDDEPGLEKWLLLNAEYAKIWPNITVKKEAPADAKDWEGVAEKFEKHFSPEPGTGD